MPIKMNPDKVTFFTDGKPLEITNIKSVTMTPAIGYGNDLHNYVEKLNMEELVMTGSLTIGEELLAYIRYNVEEARKKLMSAKVKIGVYRARHIPSGYAVEVDDLTWRAPTTSLTEWRLVQIFDENADCLGWTWEKEDES